MKFKEEKEDKEAYSSFAKLVQIEEDQLFLIEAAIAYFHINGNEQYVKFFEKLYGLFTKCKLDTRKFIYGAFNKKPECTVAELDLRSFEQPEHIFEVLASMEDAYVEELNKLIEEAYENKNFAHAAYLTNKLLKIDYICCRAVACVKNKGNVLDLLPCEQHSSEK